MKSNNLIGLLCKTKSIANVYNDRLTYIDTLDRGHLVIILSRVFIKEDHLHYVMVAASNSYGWVKIRMLSDRL